MYFYNKTIILRYFNIISKQKLIFLNSNSIKYFVVNSKIEIKQKTKYSI